MSGFSDVDKEQFAALGLKNIFDLRRSAERDAAPDELPADVRYQLLDVLADATGGVNPTKIALLLQDPLKANEELGGGKIEAAIIETYRDFVRLPSANKALRQLYSTLSEDGATPSLIHCTTGKDRTGWATAALLTLLGVPRETVMEDYLRSNEYLLPRYQKAMNDFAANGGDPEIMAAIVSVKPEYLEAAFEEMETKYGTIEEYFSKGLGIDSQGQDKLRELMISRP